MSCAVASSTLAPRVSRFCVGLVAAVTAAQRTASSTTTGAAPLLAAGWMYELRRASIGAVRARRLERKCATRATRALMPTNGPAMPSSGYMMKKGELRLALSRFGAGPLPMLRALDMRGGGMEEAEGRAVAGCEPADERRTPSGGGGGGGGDDRPDGLGDCGTGGGLAKAVDGRGCAKAVDGRGCGEYGGSEAELSGKGSSVSGGRSPGMRASSICDSSARWAWYSCRLMASATTAHMSRRDASGRSTGRDVRDHVCDDGLECKHQVLEADDEGELGHEHLEVERASRARLILSHAAVAATQTMTRTALCSGTNWQNRLLRLVSLMPGCVAATNPTRLRAA